MISPFKIKWRSYSSLDFDLWTELAFEQGDGGETETFLSKEAVISESYDGTLRRAYGYKYNEGFTFTLTFIKKNYDDITRDENRKILAWLTSGKGASFIDVYTEDSERPEFCCLGNFINVSQYKMGNSRVVGYTAEFESLTPYCHSPLWSVTSVMPCLVAKKKIPPMYQWRVDYQSTSTGPQYLYTDNINLAINTALFQYAGNEDSMSFSGFQPWDRISATQGDMTYMTTGGYIITLTGGYRCEIDSMLGGTNFILDVHTDEYEAPIYPKITIQLNDDSNIIEMDCEPIDIIEGCVYYYRPEGLYFWKDENGQIRSSTSNQSSITDSKIIIGNTYTDLDGQIHTVTCEIINNLKGETIIIDGANKVVSSDRSGGRIFGDDFDWEWIPLMNGTNTFSVIGNCIVTVEWREPIKVGQYC